MQKRAPAGSRRGRAPTIDDVARAAEVSISTVSRVLRGVPDVRAATREHVQKVIAELGYRPSPIARALVSGQTRLLALLVADMANPFYPQLAKSVEDEAKRFDYSVVICSTGDRPGETKRYLERLIHQGVDGIIHASVGRDEQTILAELPELRRVVFTNRKPASEEVSYVVSDSRVGAEQLTEYLLGRGHRRIGFIGGPDFARNASQRLEGFLEAMGRVDDAEPLISKGDFSPESGKAALQAWLAAEPPTAVIAINDGVALGALEYLADRGIAVPGELALAGFDGVRLAALPGLSLTTVDQHIDKMARRAVRVLLRQLDEPTSRPVHEVLATQLVLRNSTEGNGTAPSPAGRRRGARPPRPLSSAGR